MITLRIGDRMAVASHHTPESERQDWDAGAARRQLLDWSGVENVADATAAQRRKLARGFAFVRGAGEAMADYVLPHHYVEDDRLVVSQRGMVAAGNALRGARGGVDIPEADIRAVRAHLGEHYRGLDMEPPWSEERRAEAPAGERGARQVMVAGPDGTPPRQKLYLIMSRAEVPDSNGMIIDAAEIERSSDRFMQSLQRGSAVVGVNHACTDCSHSFPDHYVGAQAKAVACRADNCVCTGYHAFAPRGLSIVENFIAGADLTEWHGVKLAEPLRRGDHVIAVRCEDAHVFRMLSEGASVSWEATYEVMPEPPPPTSTPPA